MHALIGFLPDMVRTVAGLPGLVGFKDGPGAQAQFYGLRNLCVTPGNNLLVADELNHRVRHVDLQDGLFTVSALSEVGVG